MKIRVNYLCLHVANCKTIAACITTLLPKFQRETMILAVRVLQNGALESVEIGNSESKHFNIDNVRFDCCFS